MVKTLAIETSCDDTSVGIISFDNDVFSVDTILAYTQIQEHNIYGGVVPEIASRLHSDKIIPVVESVGFDKILDVDCISVTTHPGLPGSLLVGETIARMLGDYFQKPVIEVHHIVGHLMSLFLDRKLSAIQFPLLVLTVSGGHNDLYIIKQGVENDYDIVRGNFSIKKIGTTLDDAAGECFDKVARMLGGPYPGGVWIGEQAKKGVLRDDISFTKIWLSSNAYNFSFSGLKGQIHTLLQKYERNGKELHTQDISDIAYVFQENVVEVLSKKLLRAAMEYDVKSVAISGGVSANERRWEYLQDLYKDKQWLRNNQPSGTDLSRDREFELYKPIKNLYCTDNAAMIGVAGILKFLAIEDAI